MRVLGIDPGTAIVGYSIVDYEKNSYKVLDYGCVYTEKDKDMPERLQEIYDELESIIDIWKPTDMAIEELFFFKNQKTVIKVGQARGIILLLGQKKGLNIYSYTPLQVKMGITGYGRADKKQIQEMVKVILKLDEIPKPDDAADALAVGVTHINSNTGFGGFSRSNNMSEKFKEVKKDKISVEEYRKIINSKK